VSQLEIGQVHTPAGVDHTDAIRSVRQALSAWVGIAPERVQVVWAPYRICPLGAHIDHQLGTVTAMAIDQGVYLAFAPSGSTEVRLRSLVYPGEVRFSLEQIPPRRPGDWGNYARGAAFALSQHRQLRQGLVGVTTGWLAEVGLSSSAAIGVAYLLALEAVNDLDCSVAENIHLDQLIENHYLGLHNGILDQAAILCSRRRHLTVIDCKAFAKATDPSLAQTHQPSFNTPAAAKAVQTLPPSPALPAFSILVAFSGLTQAVITTDYNRRVAECADAARLLLQAAGRPLVPACLGLVDRAEFEAYRALISGPAARRAEHFFGEMDRVARGITAWQLGDLVKLGRLMRESGQSSIRLYECGSPPLIDLYEILNETPGIYGARFSGAGFRGCCVALADPRAAAEALPALRHAYAARQPALAERAQFFLCRPADGARLL
jgi:galacturonokinase